MSALLKALGTLVLLYASSFLYGLIRNIYHARRIGLPVFVVPFDQNHFIWMAFSVPLRPFLKRNLPTSIWNRLTLTIYGWEFPEKRRPFLQYAAPQGNDKSFMLAGCGRLELWTCDPEVTSEVLRRPRDFQQYDLTKLVMSVFGHNVLTSDGDSWARQRKIVASVINERISKTVFDESVRQTRGMINEIFAARTQDRAASASSNKMFDMLKKVTIHVLSGAGLGASVPWRNEDGQKPRPGFKMTYIESAKAVMEAVTGPIILPQVLLTYWPSWMPGGPKMKQLGVAKLEFPQHTNALLGEERRRSSEKRASRSNIMSQMIRASEQDPSTGKALSDEEMMGNLFIFTAAGFDTTANTLSFALMLLARYPMWQDWLLEEIDGIQPDDAEDFDYTSAYPKATRIMAFMFETMRLYTPMGHLVKQTHEPQTIKTSRGTICLPPRTVVYMNSVCLHLEPEVWRDINHGSDPDFVKTASPKDSPDELMFRPSRWLNPAGSQQPLFQPPKGSFVPWSMGPRVCPGQKMAQVEFTAVILTLLHEHRVDPVPVGEESREQMDERLEAKLNDNMSVLTLQMNGVYDVGENGGVPIRLSRRV
ncbi:hypothetical protein DL767_004299 [Monosporascus sp. MG133]|nr:hypothetical protein DL767_004299 [Monosporascus sp. MG133]